MAPTPEGQKGRDGVLSALDGVIQVLDLAKDTHGIPPAQVAFDPINTFLTTIYARVPFSLFSNDELVTELSRIPWPTRITSILGHHAPKYANPLTRS